METVTILPNGHHIGRIDHYKLRTMKHILNAVRTSIVMRERLEGEYRVRIVVGPFMEPASHTYTASFTMRDGVITLNV